MAQFCPKCGHAPVGGVCQNCGGAQLQPQSQPVVIYPGDPRLAILFEFFGLPNEKFICALGSGYLNAFLSGNTPERGFAVLTNKRIYVKGKAFKLTSTTFGIKNMSEAIDRSAVRGTDLKTMRSVAWIICGIIFTLVGILLLNLDNDFGKVFGPMVLCLGILECLTFIWAKKQFFSLMLFGREIGFETKWYSQDEINNFRRNL